MKNICYISTIAYPLEVHFGGHIEAISKRANVVLACDGIENISGFCDANNLTVFSVRIERKIHLINDLLALISLIKLFKKYNFDAVHSIMSKAGLLSMIAAFVVGIPIRIHTFTGQYWATKVGIYRHFLVLMDRLTAFFATNLIADSYSQVDLLTNFKIVKRRKISVLGDGSIAGVDVQKFKYDPVMGKRIREDLNIKDDATVFLFLGRLNDDKGVCDLLYAYLSLPIIQRNYYLLLVGPNEGGCHDDLLTPELMHSSNIRRIDFTDSPQNFLAATDVICLPSYREGFGSVLIEAAAAKVPSVASRVCEGTGAVVHESTGLIHDVGNVEQIALCMSRLGADKDFRERLGSQARLRALTRFNRADIVHLFMDYYHKLGLI